MSLSAAKPEMAFDNGGEYLAAALLIFLVGISGRVKRRSWVLFSVFLAHTAAALESEIMLSM